MKTPFLLALLALAASPAWAGLVYYKDAQGNIHAADSLDGIPPEFQKKVKTTDGNTELLKQKLILPLELENGRYIVPVTIGAETLNLVAKNVAKAETSISFEGVKKLGLEVNQVPGAPPTVSLPGMAVGGYRVGSVEVPVRKMNGDGVFGQELLYGLKGTYDEEKGILTLGEDRKPASAPPAPAAGANGTPVVKPAGAQKPTEASSTNK